MAKKKVSAKKASVKATPKKAVKKVVKTKSSSSKKAAPKTAPKKKAAKATKKAITKKSLKSTQTVAKKSASKTKKPAAKPAKKAVKAAPKAAAAKVAKASPASHLLKSPKAAPKKLNLTDVVVPLDNRVLVRLSGAEKMTAGGLYVPDTVADVSGNLEGTVVAVGRGHMNKKGHVRPMDVKVGDKVVFSQHSGTEIVIENEDLIIVREEDVLGVVSK